jgi:hypothetical protein
MVQYFFGGNQKFLKTRGWNTSGLVSCEAEANASSRELGALIQCSNNEEETSDFY